LNELIRISDLTSDQLKKAYEDKDTQKFNQLKKALLNVQEKISRAVK
jgi:plasmid replication initiation protein